MTQNTQFRDDEIVIMSHWDKQEGAYVNTPYPKISGRLRIAHDQNNGLSISSKIVSYDGNVAVVAATVTSDKGIFNGLGMASLERDYRIAPAILEMAESRAVARALKFSGVGVEYCSAEEISHLERGSDSSFDNKNNNPALPSSTLKQPDSIPLPANQNHNRNSSANEKITKRQHSYIMRLVTQKGLTEKELNDKSVKMYGTATEYLTKNDASFLIGDLLAA